MIHVAAPEIGDEEIKGVNDVLKSGMLAQGPKVAEFEANFAAYCGTTYAVAVNSGTAALHAALFVAGVGPGDEVITTPFSFIATINPILMVGATPVLVDIDPITFNIDPTKIEAAVTDKTKAIIPVHLYGQPCDWSEIKAIATKHKLLVIEDACQAVGATYDGVKVGNLGDLGCFSLYATKNIMCGEGGIVTTNNQGYAEALRSFRQHGMIAPYEYADLGYNYRMSDLHAAIAVEQLKKIDRFNEVRQRNARLLSAGLQSIKDLELPTIVNNRTHVFHQYTIRLRQTFPHSRLDFMTALRDKEVGSGIYYPNPLHAYPHIKALGYKLGDFPAAEQAASEVLSLPVHPKVSEADIRQIIRAVQELADV